MRVINGFNLEALKTLPEKHIQCAITSPPYYGLRDYSVCSCSENPSSNDKSSTLKNGGNHTNNRPNRIKAADPNCPKCKGTGRIEGCSGVLWSVDDNCKHEWENDEGGPSKIAQKNFKHIKPEVDRPIPGQLCKKCGSWFGQLGLEPTPEMFVDHLVMIFRELRRVMRDDGTLWVNMGDSYAGGGMYTAPGSLCQKGLKTKKTRMVTKPVDGLKNKDLIGIPWMLAFALRKDGWYLRSDIIWHKPSCMPENVQDRPTKAHEYIFLLSKSKQYYYDIDAVRNNSVKKKSKLASIVHEDTSENTGSNKRSVWSINPRGYKGAHFATYPEKLVEPMILAGSSHQACPHCGAPWSRILELGEVQSFTKGNKRKKGNPMTDPNGGGYNSGDFKISSHVTKGWEPTCECEGNDGSGKCIVLDPFSGSGTTGKVALDLDREYIGLELNPEYAKLHETRIGRPVTIEKLK